MSVLILISHAEEIHPLFNWAEDFGRGLEAPLVGMVWVPGVQSDEPEILDMEVEHENPMLEMMRQASIAMMEPIVLEIHKGTAAISSVLETIKKIYFEDMKNGPVTDLEFYHGSSP